MTPLRWAIFGAIFIVILGALVLTKQSDNIDVSNVNENKAVTKKSESEIADHIYGNKDSKVTLIEYGDFQCPGCGGLHPNLKPVVEENKENIAFIFRNFPLSSIHPNALAAASAAEAAGMQDKFWEMHDLLFENQDAWSNAKLEDRTKVFEDYAKQLELDMDKFREDVESKVVSQKIKRDQALGKKAGVESTPTLVLNGKKLSQDQFSSKEALEKTIANAIKENNQ